MFGVCSYYVYVLLFLGLIVVLECCVVWRTRDFSCSYWALTLIVCCCVVIFDTLNRGYYMVVDRFGCWGFCLFFLFVCLYLFDVLVVWVFDFLFYFPVF